MIKKFFTDKSLENLVNKIKAYVNEVISTKADIGHTHSISNVSNLQNTLNNKSNTNHNHDTVYATKDDLDEVSTAVAGKANSSHSHNDIYYTETEIDTLLSGKANSSHTHSISNITNLQTTLDGKAATSHGTHVSYSTTAPIMDGTASVGTATTVARSDHKHPTDTSRASQTSLDTHTSNKSNPHGVSLSQLGVTATATELNYVDGVTSNVQTQLNEKAASSHNHGLLHTDFTKQIDNTTTDSGWSMINDSYSGFILKSLRTQKDAPEWTIGNYSAGVAFGGADTKGVITHAYNSPQVCFSGGNGTKPTWNFTLNATSGKKYTLPSSDGTIALTSSNITGNAATASAVAWSGITSKPSYYDAKAIKSITRNGTTFTYTCMDGTTGTFTQQDNDTNTKVTNTLATTTKAYVTGTTSATTNTGTQVFDTGVYLDTTAGKLTATTFNGTTFSGSGVATVSEVKTYLGI